MAFVSRYKFPLAVGVLVLLMAGYLLYAYGPWKGDQLPVVRVAPDFADSAALREAMTVSDAVLSAIGPRSSKDAPVAAPATRAILAAHRALIVVISAAPRWRRRSPRPTACGRRSGLRG